MFIYGEFNLVNFKNQIMNSSINLKLRSPKGILSLENIAVSVSFSDFKKEISKKTGIALEALIIKVGYPPKNIAQSPDTTPLTSLNISSGDLIIIEENPNAPKPITKEEPTKILDLNSIRDEQIPNKDGLIMIRRIIPSDNSCLFHAIAQNLNPKSPHPPDELRQIVASYIISDPKNYEGILEKSPEEYAEWIMKDASWGGEVEMSILAKHYDIEICAVNIQNCQSFFYGKGKKRIIVLYDGIHYDAVVRNISEDIKEIEDQSLFDKEDKFALEGAVVLANGLRKKRQFTDLTNFSIQCNVCYEGLKGQKEVVEHMKNTGHTNFKEVNKEK